MSIFTIRPFWLITFVNEVELMFKTRNSVYHVDKILDHTRDNLWSLTPCPNEEIRILYCRIDYTLNKNSIQAFCSCHTHAKTRIRLLFCKVLSANVCIRPTCRLWHAWMDTGILCHIRYAQIIRTLPRLTLFIFNLNVKHFSTKKNFKNFIVYILSIPMNGSVYE